VAIPVFLAPRDCFADARNDTVVKRQRDEQERRGNLFVHCAGVPRFAQNGASRQIASRHAALAVFGLHSQ